MSVLYGLQGTSYGLNKILDSIGDQPVILFVEDVGERHYHIDRMMQNLRMSGVLKRIKGMIVGQFTEIEEDKTMGCSVQETIMQAVSQYDYPVMFNFPAGHVDENYPLWFNKTVHLRVGQQNEMSELAYE